MSYYDFSSSSTTARRPQRSKAGLSIVVVIAALAWGGMRVLWEHSSQPSVKIDQVHITPLPELDETNPTPAAQAATQPQSDQAPQFHRLIESNQADSRVPAATDGYVPYHVIASP